MADRPVLPRSLTESDADDILAHDFGPTEPATFAASPASPMPDLGAMHDLLEQLSQHPRRRLLVRLTLNPDDLERWKALLPLVLDAPNCAVLGAARIDLQTNAHIPPGRGAAHYDDDTIEIIEFKAKRRKPQKGTS